MANIAKKFSAQVGVGKRYLQAEANAYKSRGQQPDMDPAEIARREFQVGRKLSDAELKGQTTAPLSSPVTQTPTPAPTSSYTQQLQTQTPVPAPQPVSVPAAQPTQSAPVIDEPITPAAQPMPDAYTSAPQPQQPLVIPIYGNSNASGGDEKSVPEATADAVV